MQYYQSENRNSPIIHRFNISKWFYTLCWRDSEFVTNNEKDVTCKKCLGGIRIAQNKIPKKHLEVTAGSNIEELYYDVACHSVGGVATRHIDLVNCKKCLNIINKSIRACQ